MLFKFVKCFIPVYAFIHYFINKMYSDVIFIKVFFKLYNYINICECLFMYKTC